MEIKPFDHKVWLSSPTMHGEELKYVTEAYETNWMSTVGENINEVERLACEKIGCKYAVALSAGTAALHMAVKLAAGEEPAEFYNYIETPVATQENVDSLGLEEW